MKIETTKDYYLEKYEFKGNDIKVYKAGILPGVDVKSILKGYKYDETVQMFFSKHCNIGYWVDER